MKKQRQPRKGPLKAHTGNTELPHSSGPVRQRSRHGAAKEGSGAGYTWQSELRKLGKCMSMSMCMPIHVDFLNVKILEFQSAI